MPRDRFLHLSRYLHLNDNTTAQPFGEPGYDPLHKIRPLYSRVQQTISEGYNPGQNIAVDEAMAAYKGRSFMKQYMPGKPTQWGFKIWCLADSSNGYMCNMDIYTGKRAHPSPKGLGYDVVTGLVADHRYKYHHLYFDNFFTSVPLLDDLRADKVYSCGTVRANRKGLPAIIGKPGRMAQGASVKRQRGSMVATVWHDKRDVRILSTNSQPTDGTVVRRKGAARQEVTCPTAVIDYNRSMGGVDLADQNRSYYHLGREAKKSWKCLFWFMMNTCIVNSFVIYRETKVAAGQKPLSHLGYRRKLLAQMIGGFTCRQRCGRRGAETPAIEESQFAGHILVKSSKKVCKNCSQLKRKTPGGRGIQSTFKCNTCGVNLCQGGCLVEFHTRHTKK